MTIDVHFNSPTVAELQVEMRALLNGEGRTSTIDAYAAAMAAQQGVSGSAGGVTVPKRQTAAEKKAAEKAAAETAGTGQGISSGEGRTDPVADAQDAKDEAADTAAQKAAAPAALTHDDVKNVLSGYVQAYGLPAAQEDGAAYIYAPALSKIPNTQADLAKAILGVAEAIEKNPKKREINGDGMTAEKIAQIRLIVAAARAVK